MRTKINLSTDVSDVNLPANPQNGKALVYDANTNKWTTGATGVAIYNTINDLPLTNNIIGSLAVVESTQFLYVWVNSTWSHIATINLSPTSIYGSESNYILNNEGTPLVITLVSSDPEGFPLTWGYQVTSGSLTNGGGTTATVSQNNNVFTITPSTNADYAGTFGLTFSVSDGTNITTTVSSFSLVFDYINSKYTTLLLNGNGNPAVLPFNADASTNNFNIAINGDAKPDRFNPYQEGYYSLLGTVPAANLTTLVSTPTSANLRLDQGNWTIEFWLYVNSWNTNNALFDTGANGDSTVMRINYLSTGAVSFGRPTAGTGVTTASGAITLNRWYHIALTTETGNTNGRIWINGVLSAGPTVYTQWTGTTAAFNIGRNNVNGADWSGLNGYMSNFRFVSGQQLYTSNFTPDIAPLTNNTYTTNGGTSYSSITGTCQLLTLQDNRFIDKSVNNFALTTTSAYAALAYFQPFTPPNTVANYGSGYFDGTGDYLTVAWSTAFTLSTNDFTIECWVYPTTSGTQVGMIQNWTTGGQFFLRKTASDRPEFAFVTSAQTTITGTSTTIVANTWNHVAVVRNGSSFKIYVNGVQDSATATNTGAITGTGKAIKVGIGPDDGSPLTGYISNARIVNGTAVYTANFTPPTAPLTAITNTSLLTLQNNRPTNNSVFVDSSPNNFLVTRNGNTTQGSFGPYGSNWSNYFDGTGDYLTFSAVTSPSTGDFTVEFWLYNTRSAWNTAFDITDGSSGAMAIFFGSDGNFRIAPQNQTSTNLGSVSSLPLNQWNHFAVIRSSGSIRAYANGTALAAAAAYTTGMSGFTKLGGTGDGYVLGYLSNFRYTTTAVYSISASTITVPTSPLTAITGTALLTCQSNRLIDNSANNFTITKNGDIAVQRFNPFGASAAYSTSVIGGSGYFDGTGDYLVAPDNDALEPGSSNLTWEVWINTTSSTQYATLYSRTTATFASGMWTLMINLASSTAGDAGLYVANFSTASPLLQTTGVSVRDNAWHHIAVVRNGSSWVLYVDGISRATATWAGTIANIAGGPYIGSDQFYGRNYAGYMSNLRIVNNTALYTANFTPPTAPLTAIANTSLLTCQSNTFKDNSTNNFAITQNGDVVGNAQLSTAVKKFGNSSLSFDGTLDSLKIVDNPNINLGTSDFTIECWAYFNVVNAEMSLINKGWQSSSAYASYLIYMTSGGSLRFNASTNGGAWDIANEVVIGAMTATTWTHIAVTRSGTTYRAFINGAIVSGFTFTNSGSHANIAAQALYIGGVTNNNSSMNGYLDDVRITKGYARYTANFTPPTSDLQG